jgi:ATP-dependent Lon protease
MEVVSLPGYSEEEKRRIARHHLLPKVIREHGLPPGAVRVSDGALTRIITAYTREAGVRQLERMLAAVARKVARRVAEGGETPVAVSSRQLRSYLGRERYRVGAAEREHQVGVATAVYTSDAGGDTMPVEVGLMAGRGRLLLTGKLGEVMQESARAAFTYLKAHLQTLGVPAEQLGQCDVHVHVPDAATPKEGPSAGITIATAMVSAFTGRPVRRQVAMTGEVTLRGRVLPVGGLKEKMLAARRSGLEVFLYPKANAPEVAELPPDVRRGLRLVPVAQMSEVLALALTPDRTVPALPAPRRASASASAVQWQ